MPISKFFYPKYDIDLKRLGNEYDGGYLISKTTLKNTKNLISLGINDDWSFEKDFNKNNLKANIYCFDNQLDLRFLIKRLIVDLVFFIFNFNLQNIYKKIYKIIDCDNLRDLKVMTYLTDVNNDDQGPFEIIEDTHSFNFFNPLAYVMGTKLRIEHKYVIKKFSNKVKSFLGVAGSSFIVDTRAFHRGKTINQKNFFRLIIQLYFSASAFGKNKNNPKLNQFWPSYGLWKDVLETKKNYINLF